jgi:hypothetical protein
MADTKILKLGDGTEIEVHPLTNEAELNSPRTTAG